MSFHKSPYNIAWRVSNVIQIPIGLMFVALSMFYPERYVPSDHDNAIALLMIYMQSTLAS